MCSAEWCAGGWNEDNLLRPGMSDPDAWKADATGSSFHPDVWRGPPNSWFELIFGVGYAVLRTEIDRECGPMYRMWLEQLDG